MTAQTDCFDPAYLRGQKAKRAGQAQAVSGLPASVRLTIGSCVRMLARNERPFTFGPTVEGHPCVMDELPPATKDILSRHKNALGAIASALSGNKFLKAIGYATASGEDSKGHVVRLWTIHPNAK